MDNNCRVVILLVLAFVASVTSTHVIHRNKFEEGLLKVIDKCKNGDVQSLPIPSLPSLKRLALPPIHENVEGFTVSSTTLYVTGLELMSLETLTTSESRLSILIEFNVPKLKLHADQCKLRGKVMWFIPVSHQSSLNAHVENLRVKAEMRFASKGNDTVISNLDLNFSFSDVQVSLGSSIIENIVNRQIPGIVNDQGFKNNLKNKVITISQSYLRGHTPQEFIKIISSI